MRKSLIILGLLFISIIAFSQEKNQIEKVKISTFGTSELQNGMCIIEISDNIEDYTVVLTPIGEQSNLFLVQKDKKSFTVKSNDSSNAKFDYTIIEKKTKVRLQEDEYLKQN